MAETTRLLCVFSGLIFLSEGWPDVIQARQTVTAAVGGEVDLCCRLLQPKDVRQVTWQKLSAAGETDMASSNKFFGQRVNLEFSEKVAFTNASLENCSIVLRQVEEQDEGCYRCLFHVYPEGPVAGKTCLQLQELHEPLLHVSIPDPPAVHQMVQCQATGRPNPNVTLSVSYPGLRLSNHSWLRVSNGNGTTTVNASALLWGSAPLGATVNCTVQLQSGPELHAVVTLPEGLQTSEKSERPTTSTQTSRIELLSYVLLALGLLFFIIASIIALVIFRRQQKRKGQPQINNTPQREAQNLTGPNQTPSTGFSSNRIMKRTPQRPHDCIKSPLSTARMLSY